MDSICATLPTDAFLGMELTSTDAFLGMELTSTIFIYAILVIPAKGVPNGLHPRITRSDLINTVASAR
jgi:hypothetical protein